MAQESDRMLWKMQMVDVNPIGVWLHPVPFLPLFRVGTYLGMGAAYRQNSFPLTHYAKDEAVQGYNKIPNR